jgi:hypothetical protein
MVAARFELFLVNPNNNACRSGLAGQLHNLSQSPAIAPVDLQKVSVCCAYTESINMETEMTQDDVLGLFRQQAATLGEVQSTQTDIIMRLAQLLADSKGRLSKENFEELVHIGAVMYQESAAQFRARTEVAAIMNKSDQQP